MNPQGVDGVEGLPEAMLRKQDDQYRFERETGPRFISPGIESFCKCKKFVFSVLDCRANLVYK